MSSLCDWGSPVIPQDNTNEWHFTHLGAYDTSLDENAAASRCYNRKEEQLMTKYKEESCQGNWLLSDKLTAEHSCYISVVAEFLTSSIINLFYWVEIKYEFWCAPQTCPLCVNNSIESQSPCWHLFSPYSAAVFVGTCILCFKRIPAVLLVKVE